LTGNTEQGEVAACSPDRLKYSHTAKPHASNRTAKATAMNQRKMRIGISIRGHGYHPAAWRHPDVPADGALRTASPHFPDATGRPTGKHALTSPSLKQPCARSILNG
jgi:hypothetical protein